MILVLTGAPGAGKGTQADLIQERLKFRKVSTGDALRKHVAQGTEIGKKAGALIAEGRLVPDDILLGVLKTEVGADPSERVLLDGYPRNVAQAESLRQLQNLHPVRAAIHLDVERNTLIARLTGRRVCSGCGKSFHVASNPPKVAGICDYCGGQLVQRNDDAPEKVAVRLDVYDRETKPVLDYYSGKGLTHVVDGSQAQEEVYRRLAEIIRGIA